MDRAATGEPCSLAIQYPLHEVTNLKDSHSVGPIVSISHSDDETIVSYNSKCRCPKKIIQIVVDLH